MSQNIHYIFRLRNENTIRNWEYLNTQKIMQNTNICHVKEVNKLLIQSKNDINIIVGYDKVINIYNNDQSFSMSIKYIYVVIKFTTFGTKTKNETVDLSISRSRSFLQTIKRLLKSKYQVKMCNKTTRLVSFHSTNF
jgi:hypothetical protein